MDELRKELDEVRKLKDDLKAEISEIKNSTRKKQSRTIHFTPPEIDLSGLSESLDDMMHEVSIQINDSLKGVKMKVKDKKRAKDVDYQEVETIPPERVARIISPLGSEERLFILDLLKQSSRTFNELEQYTGKTGSSLTHHLNPLLNAGYVIKGEVRGTYYITVEGRLAYRLSQWLTDQVENERLKYRAPDEPEHDNQEGWY